MAAKADILIIIRIRILDLKTPLEIGGFYTDDGLQAWHRTRTPFFPIVNIVAEHAITPTVGAFTKDLAVCIPFDGTESLGCLVCMTHGTEIRIIFGKILPQEIWISISVKPLMA